MSWKQLFKYGIIVLLVVLLLTPVGALFQISKLEQSQYTAPTVDASVVLVERAYGDILEVSQTDLKERIELSGQVICTGYLYQEVNLESPHLLRLWAQSGDYLVAGDPIGIYKGETIYSSTNGIISKISMGTEAYIEFYDLSTLSLECYVTEDIHRILSRSNLALSDQDGISYEVIRIEDVPTRSGLYRVLIRPIDGSLTIGTSISDFSMFTGRTYPNCIVVQRDCVYTRDGLTYYVRLVDSNGIFIEEVPVEIGETVGDLICVSGVEQGQYCDSGYKAVVESS